VIDRGEDCPAEDDLPPRLTTPFGLVGTGREPLALGAQARQAFVDAFEPFLSSGCGQHVARPSGRHALFGLNPVGDVLLKPGDGIRGDASMRGKLARPFKPPDRRA